MTSLIKTTCLYKKLGLLFLSIMTYGHAVKNDSEYYRQLYNEIAEQTNTHINYLCSIGLTERAQGIKIQPFTLEIDDYTVMCDNDLALFEFRLKTPQEVLDFDPHKKNTLITTDPTVAYNRPEDLQRILDIRLYPVLKNFILCHKTEVFLGTRQEMAAYYNSRSFSILFEFIIPSSAVYYLAESNQGQLYVIMAGLVSKENLIAQLLTLKLTDVKIETIEIIGRIEHFTELVQRDIANMLKKLPAITRGKNILIIAGCGLEKMASKIIKQEFGDFLGEVQNFEGNIISLLYHTLKHPINDIHGCISLHLNYGEIVEEIIKLILQNCSCKYIFSGSAGGYIAHNDQDKKPQIGNRAAILQSINEQGEIVTLDQTLKIQNAYVQDGPNMHLHIASIFLETYEWLAMAKQRGNSVDVETFYIIRAIQNYNLDNPNNLTFADCGYFISDYVGEQPLREYSRVYAQYANILSEFLKNCYCQR